MRTGTKIEYHVSNAQKIRQYLTEAPRHSASVFNARFHAVQTARRTLQALYTSAAVSHRLYLCSTPFRRLAEAHGRVV